MLKTRNFILVILAVVFLSSIVFAAPQQQVDLLRVGVHNDENTLTPYTYVTGSPGLEMVYLVYDALFQLDKDNIPQPWLVEDYELSPDSLVYTFKLAEGVKWHDGADFTADDVKFTYDYLVAYPKSRFTNPVKRIQKIEVVDKLTVRMTLAVPDPNFLIQPIADLPILPKHLWESVDKPNEADIRIGTGPYILEDYKSDQYYKFAANPDYFKGTPVAKILIFPIIKDNTALFTALKSSDLDAVTRQLTPELVTEFERMDKIALSKGAGYSTTLLQLNHEKHPFNIKGFREALFMAVDRNDIVNIVLLGQAVLGSPGFIHPDSPFYNPAVAKAGNKNKAVEILDQLGFKDVTGNGFREDADGKELKLTMLVYANNPIRIRAAELLTESFKGVGLDITVKAMDINTVDSLVWPDFDVTKGRDFDMTMWGWSATMQLFPSRLVELFHSDLSKANVNIGAFGNEEFDRLADELRVTMDDAARKDLINKMQAIVANEFPIIPLYYENIVNAYDKTVFSGWEFRSGTGIINKLSFISEASAQPPDTTPPAPKDDSGSGLMLWLFLAAAAVAGGFFFLKRGKQS
ncbi:MAG: hypothetical protein KGZ79_05020 [Dethiobacter sp.]|jgi:peptide/nickel transport system substrate-binding protein|nr:hypothetical protein [Dethiobacter sp.]